jgi:hypothetical protein
MSGAGRQLYIKIDWQLCWMMVTMVLLLLLLLPLLVPVPQLHMVTAVKAEAVEEVEALKAEAVEAMAVKDKALLTQDKAAGNDC